MTLRLYNTATRSLEEFTPLHPPVVTMYNCGPTVYDEAHIGNLRSYVFADILRRTLEANEYNVTQVINITDVGHLVGDGDDGEDKMSAALKREGKPFTKEAMYEVGEFYTKKFKQDLEELNILHATLYPKASQHIAEDIALIEILSEKGFTYATSDGIYFDTNKFPHYANFAQLDIAGMRAGARIEVGEKKHSTDFALWKFNDALGYDAPFGKGFPGWHIECSAMIHKHLGHPIDIHTGGIDHIPVHHTNEIAQSESAYGAPFVNTWMHNAHMTVDGEKMSKSLNNGYTLADLKAHGITPLAYRYWLLTAHYRTQVNFTWEAMSAAQDAYDNLRKKISQGRNIQKGENVIIPPQTSELIKKDLNTAVLIAYIWSLIQGQYLGQGIIDEIKEADKILGLNLLDWEPPEKVEITPELQSLIDARKKARDEKNWTKSDEIREQIRQSGFEVKDTPEGQTLEKI